MAPKHPPVPEVEIPAANRPTDNQRLQTVLDNHRGAIDCNHEIKPIQGLMSCANNTGNDAQAFLYQNGIADITALDSDHHFQRILADKQGHVVGSTITYTTDKELADKILAAAKEANSDPVGDTLGPVRDVIRNTNKAPKTR